jgi:hypothetical protein
MLTDTPPAPPEQGPEPPSAAPPPPSGASAQASAPGSACAHCGQAMAPGQDWCLHCGAGAPGSVGGGGWRGAAGTIAVTAALVLGAAAAGVAALSKKRPVAPVVTTTLAQVAPPAATAPAVTTPTTPAGGVTTPPIPLKAKTPPPAATTPAATTPKATEKTTEKAKKEETSTSQTGGSGSEPAPEAILLDTNAAQTYNPYAYSAAGFGDPSLAIDGDTSTAWTAQINPASAPRMAEGLLIDLKTAQKLSFLKLVTTTPGMVVQIYGANGHTVPGSITDKAWVSLSRSLTIHRRHAKIGLRNKKLAYRFVTLWISRAPTSAVGTPEAPGHVTVNEIELFPAK